MLSASRSDRNHDSIDFKIDVAVQRKVELSVENLDALMELLEEIADDTTWANALRVTVASINVRVRAMRTGGIAHNEYIGELRFHPGFGIGRPVAIPDEAIGYRKIWREIATLARDASRPIHLADVMRHIGSEDPSLASYHVHRATKAGVLKKLGRTGGWAAI